jgi:heat shock protein HtpX
MPRLRIMETERLNAFATGLNEKQYAITVTRGLLDNLDDAEVEAVLAHELTHIRNEDVRLMVTAVIIAGVISFFGELVFRWLDILPRWGSSSSSSSRHSDRKGSGGGAFVAILIALAMIAIAWALSLVIRFALSRSREYLADSGSVELTKNPDAMISALTKISGKGELESVPSGLMEMCVDNPRSGFTDLFATHPPIEARIDALVRYAGGRQPEPQIETSPEAATTPAGLSG